MSDKKVIVSPLPGIFYRKPSPDQPDYVQEGDNVKCGDIVGLIEVMKNFYEIKVEEDGVIDRFAAQNESIVDVDQELVILK